MLLQESPLHSDACTHPALPTRKPCCPRRPCNWVYRGERPVKNPKGSFQKGPGRGDNTPPPPPCFSFLFLAAEFAGSLTLIPPSFGAKVFPQTQVPSPKTIFPLLFSNNWLLPSFLRLWESRMSEVGADQASVRGELRLPKNQTRSHRGPLGGGQWPSKVGNG